MNQHTVRRIHTSVLLLVTLGMYGASLAADPGRLFYTPDQRAQLENARIHHATGKPGWSDSAPAPLRYDGVVIRSDGKTTRWVDGKAEAGASSVKGLKPGQIRADGKVYEPYQVLRPAPSSPAEAAADVKGSTP